MAILLQIIAIKENITYFQKLNANYNNQYRPYYWILHNYALELNSVFHLNVFLHGISACFSDD